MQEGGQQTGLMSDISEITKTRVQRALGMNNKTNKNSQKANQKATLASMVIKQIGGSKPYEAKSAQHSGKMLFVDSGHIQFASMAHEYMNIWDVR